MTRLITVRYLAALGAACLAVTVVAGCGGSQPDTSTSSSSSSSPSSSSGASAPAAADTAWMLETMPTGDRGVAVVKQEAKEGDRVVIRGRIGGRLEPMTEGAALFVMMDPAIPSCADADDDHCPTPHDYCCESRESITENSATVQLVGADGAVLPIDLATHGLKPLDEVVVVGVVGPRPDPAVLVIHAEGIHRVTG